MRFLNQPQLVLEEGLGVEIVTVVFNEAQEAYNTVCSSRPVEGRVLLVKQHVLQVPLVFKQHLPIVAQGAPFCDLRVVVKSIGRCAHNRPQDLCPFWGVLVEDDNVLLTHPLIGLNAVCKNPALAPVKHLRVLLCGELQVRISFF